MTRAEMHTLLEVFTEDAADTHLTDAQKDLLLSRAQEELMRLLPPEALHEFEVDFYAQALSDNSGILDNSLDLSALGTDAAWGFQWGINGVRNPSNKKWGMRISFRKYMENQQAGYAYNSEAFRYLLRGDYLQVEPDSISTVDVFTFDKPLAISSSQDSEFNDFYHIWIVELAAWFTFRADNKPDRAAAHYAAVAAGIAELKTKLPMTDENHPLQDELTDDDHGLESYRIRITGP